MGGCLYFLGLYFGLPILVAKLLLGASWHALLVAYGLWFAGLLAWGLSSARKVNEGIGWAVIMGMFLSAVAVPVIVIALKLVGIR